MDPATPLHRRPPPPETLIPQNKYVGEIVAMRTNYNEALQRYESRVKAYDEWKASQNENIADSPHADVVMNDAVRPETPDPRERPTGHISQAVKEMNKFKKSGSQWTSQHLANFQVVVLKEQTAPNLFPAVFLVRDVDPTMNVLREDGFLTTDAGTIRHSRWDTTKPYNQVFLTLMQLSRGGNRTPSPQTSPPIRTNLPRTAKDIARDSIKQISDQYYSFVSSGESTSDSSFLPLTSDDMSQMADLGARETMSFTLIHNLLSYLGTIEHQNRPESPLWINWPDSDRFSVVAAGEIFTSENDGSIYVWHRRPSGMRKRNSLPICIIECKRHLHQKPEDSILAQEAAEIIALASQNLHARKPSVSRTDEAYVIGCHDSTIHIAMAVVPPEYLMGIAQDDLKEDQFLILKRGQKWDLLNPRHRYEGCREILSLLRYLCR